MADKFYLDKIIWMVSSMRVLKKILNVN